MSIQMEEDLLGEALNAAIDCTISQDFAAGHSAEQGRRLRGFNGEGKSDESTSRPPVELSSQLSQETRGIPSLQDYQTQLMFLEQQNQKRLSMARQEQEGSAQSRAEHSELSRKRQKLDATVNDTEENLDPTSSTMGQVMHGLDQASDYEVPSLRQDHCTRD